jgi:tripartite ATP-independent transporter DctP family solute receptor
MKKVIALATVGAMVLSLAACGGSKPAETTAAAAAETTAAAAAAAETKAEAAPAADEPSVTLKLGFSTNEEDPRAKASEQFKKEVEEKTNGSVTVEIYPSGQLGGDADLINSISLDSGTVDVIITDASNFATYEPKMGISALPFLFDGFDKAWEFMDGEIEAAAEAGLIEQNMRVLAHYDNGFRCVTNSKGPVETPDDMKGMLIRTPENQVIMATMSALGANPQPLAFSELYQALQQKTYDAQENPIPIIYNNKLFEVQEFLSVTNHIYSGLCFAISGSAWDSLTAEQQEIVTAAAKASGEWQSETIRQQTDDLVANLEEEGMKVNFPELAPFAEATKSVIEENALGISEDLLTALAALSEEAAA